MSGSSGTSAKRHTVRHGISSSAVFGVASIAASLVLLPIIIHEIGSGPYGVWLLLSTLSSYLYQADLGMGAAIVHFLARGRTEETRTHRLQIIGSSFAWMSVAGLIVLPIYSGIGALIVTGRASGAGVSTAERWQLFGIGAVLVVALGLRAFPAALQGTGHWVFQRRTQTFGVLVRVVGTLIACYAIGSVVAVAAAEALALLIPLLLSTVRAGSLGLISLRRRHVSRETLRMLLSYSLRSFAVGATVAILMQADALIVGLVANAAAVTYYSAAFRGFSMINQMLGWITDPLLPALSRVFASDRERARRMLIGMMFLSTWIAVWGAVTLILGSPDLVRLWLGSGVPVNEIAVAMSVLLLIPVTRATSFPAVAASGASGRPGAFLRQYVYWCVGDVVLSIVLGLWLGIVGVAIGTLLPLIVLQPSFVRRIDEVLGIPPSAWWSDCIVPALRPAVPALLAAGAAAAAAAAAGADGWIGISAAAGFGVVYGAASLLMRRRLPISSLATATAAEI